MALSKLVLTKQATDDQVGPASVPKYGDSVTQEAIHRFDHPWCSSQAGDYCYLPFETTVSSPCTRACQSQKHHLVCSKTLVNLHMIIMQPHTHAMQILTLQRLPQSGGTNAYKGPAHMIRQLSSTTSSLYRCRVKLKLVFVEERNGQACKPQNSLHKIH